MKPILKWVFSGLIVPAALIAESHALPAFLPVEDEGILLTNTLHALVSTVESPEGKKLFEGDFTSEEFKGKADQVTFQFVDHELKDRFGKPRCLLNQDGSSIIEVTRWDNCLETLKNNPDELDATLLHEVLNMLYLERPTKDIGSIYSISRKILILGSARVHLEQKYVLHPTCEVWSGSGGFYANVDLQELSSDQIAYLTSKGYRYEGQWDSRRVKSVNTAIEHRTDLNTLKPLILQLDLLSRTRETMRPAILGVSLRITGLNYVPGFGTLHAAPAYRQPFQSLYTSTRRVRVRVKSRWGYQNENIIRAPKSRVDTQLFNVPECVAVPLLSAGTK